ncbi:MAG: hypothetical protein HZC10_05720 [Nitrospirae bacterium]|nr:hypothetical protein [Nitrospirota bacterium]
MKNAVKKIYFQGADDKDMKNFADRFLNSGLFWIYIAINPKKDWKSLYQNLSKEKQILFKDEYNKAFLLSRSYRKLTKLFLGRGISLKNYFLPKEAETEPDKFIKYNRADELRWKEVLELIS